MFAAAILSLTLAGNAGSAKTTVVTTTASADCACGSGRQGILARRAERRAERKASACGSCESAELVTETQQPAVITTRTVQPVKTITGPKRSTTTITPTGAAQTVQPKGSK